MQVIFVTLHILVAFALILIVLLQTGKGASMGAAFGGASQTIFGTRGAATFLHKLTTVAAIVFMLTSLGLAMSSSKKEFKSLMEGRGVKQERVKETKPPDATPHTGEEHPAKQ